MAWPPRSPDFTPLVFFPLGLHETLIYLSPVNSKEDLIARIVDAVATIRQADGIFARKRNYLLRRPKGSAQTVTVAT